MKIGDKLIPSFNLDSSGIEKQNSCIIVEIDEDLHYVRTNFNLLFPIHTKNIVSQNEVDEDTLTNYKSKVWIHVEQ